MIQLKRTCAKSIGGLWGDEPTGGDDDVRVVRVADFDYERLSLVEDIPTIRTVPERLREPRLLRTGDLLIEKSGGGDHQNVGRVVEWNGTYPAISSNFINVLRPSPGFHPRFLAYLHRALYQAGLAAACTKQTTGIQNLDLRAYLAHPVEAPSKAEQAIISDFLDRECARISDLSEHLDAASETAAAVSTDVLRRLVLEGDYPFVPIKFYARTGTGHTPSREHPEYWVAEDRVVPWFTLADVHQIRDGRRNVVTETAERISEVGIANSSAVNHPAGTVLLSRTASVGFSAVMGIDMAVSQDFMTWTCGPGLDPHYLLVALRAMQPELRRLMYGSTHKTIYMPDLHALRVPLPALERQQEILVEARAQAASLWPLVDEIDEIHARLLEYRDALITEAVSGTLDVRDEESNSTGEWVTAP